MEALGAEVRKGLRWEGRADLVRLLFLRRRWEVLGLRGLDALVRAASVEKSKLDGVRFSVFHLLFSREIVLCS